MQRFEIKILAERPATKRIIGNINMLSRLFISVLLPVFIIFDWSIASGVEKNTGKIKVFVSIPPQAYFVECVGGRHVDVKVLLGPGQSPTTYEPSARQMSELGRSQVYFRIGIPFEKVLIKRITRIFNNLCVVDTRQNVKLLYFNRPDSYLSPDPHIWLDPKRVKIQASTVCKALSQIDPAHTAEFEKNFQDFQTDLDELDIKIAETLAPLRGRIFYVFHPAFGYFGDSYGLNQLAVEIEGKKPSQRQLAEIIVKAKKDNVKVVFVQPQFARKNAETVARALDGAVVPIDPLSRDYLRNLTEVAVAIKNALSDQ